MKILYYDCFAGISGDMNLGALIDLGVNENYLVDKLNELSISNEFELQITRKQKMGIEGTKVDVILENSNKSKHNHHGHSHKYGHTHEHNHNQKHEHTHEHRKFKDIKEIINSSTLNDDIKKLSLNIFMEVAKAEAKVHGKSIDEVHFHEVGAVDSIVDIVGAAICIEYLDISMIMASTIELGGGFVKCAHGTIPVPAPATVEILRDVPVSMGKVNRETTTPTGAAILKANVSNYTDAVDFNIIKTGYGLGTKDFDIPNVLRVYLAELNDYDNKATDLIVEKQIMVEANIDDMNPELYSYIENMLLEKGALDVYKSNIIMKKGRPAIKLSVLTTKNLVEIIEDILFTETTTLGVREYEVIKKMLKRDYEIIDTKYGELTVKKGLRNGNVIKVKPEYEECKVLAMKNEVPITDIYLEVTKSLLKGE